MGLENRVRNCFKAEKNHMYARYGGGSQPEAINGIYLALARKFKVPVKRVKEITNPGGWFGGHE